MPLFVIPHSFSLGLWLVVFAVVGWRSLDERQKTILDDDDFPVGFVCVIVFVWGVCLIVSTGALWVFSGL